MLPVRWLIVHRFTGPSGATNGAAAGPPAEICTPPVVCEFSVQVKVADPDAPVAEITGFSKVSGFRDWGGAAVRHGELAGSRLCGHNQCYVRP